jgi:ribosomal protein S18 acetylase RimI-like enzyme
MEKEFPMNAELYLADPCGASSLPFWKTEQFAVPEGICVYRNDAFSVRPNEGVDEPYFKLMHDLRQIQRSALPAGFRPVSADPAVFARHINSCYGAESVTEAELLAYRRRPTYDPALWLAVEETGSGEIAASAIGELDGRIGEGILEWIQVSPAYRRRGLGRYLVCELLRRMHTKAKFVTVSGRVDNPDDPFSLYTACGFTHPVIWHVLRTK